MGTETTSTTIINESNLHMLEYVKLKSAHLIYADMIYDDFDFEWIDECYRALRPNGSLFIQTDYRSVAEVKIYADSIFKPLGFLNNWIIWPYDWGGRPKDAFGRKHDDILWYVKGSNFQFYPDRVQIKKTIVNNGLNPSGRSTKTPTDVWSDIGNFMTTSKERIKGADGVGIRWQKPERLIERIVLATTNKGDLVVDPFLGTGTTAAVCKRLKRSCIGFDTDPAMIKISRKRITKIK